MAVHNTKEARKKFKKTKNKETSTIIVFAIVLILVLGCFTHYKKTMPDVMLKQGKQYYEIGEYKKALDLFERVEKATPYDTEPIYYQALALSKLPPTYENQKALHEIAQLDDCEEASNLAEKILMNMRKQLEKQVGSNYADNILYDELLIRWNNSKPITYSILANENVSQENIEAIRKAFQEWQKATNGEIKFKEEENNKNANICVNFVEDVTFKEAYDKDRAGNTVPLIENDTLKRMDIYIRKTNTMGYPYNAKQTFSIAEHQIGHALGLSGHSYDEKDVMHHTGDLITAETKAKRISQRDINTLMLLYKMVPSVIDIELEKSEYANLLYHEIITTYPGENYELEIQRLIAELKHDRKNIIVWVDLAINYAYKKQYARSNHVLKNVLPLVETDVQNQYVILYNLAVNYYQMKEYKTSENYLELAKTLADDMDVQILETFLDIRLGRVKLAKEKLKVLVKQYPDNIEIALKLAGLYNKEKERTLEKEVIDNLIKNNPKAIRDRRVVKYKSRKKNPNSTK